jgi:hypothetical protein
VKGIFVMTPQEIFDKVATHLAKQGHRAVDGDSCMYRGSKGTMCAMGCLIPDEEYNHDTMEGRGASVLLVHYFVQDKPVMMQLYNNRELVRELQASHDVSDREAGLSGRPATINGRLREVASQFSLDVSIIDTLTFPKVWK